MKNKRSTAGTIAFLASLPARLYAFYMGAIFLFGQLFAGHFSPGATIAGVCGLITSVLPILTNERARRIAASVSLAALAGVALDAYHYYTKLDIPGNYYAWFLIGPFAVAVAFLGARHMASFERRVPGPNAEPE